MNIKKASEIIEGVISAVSGWNKIAQHCGIPQNQIKSIATTHRLKWK